MPESIIITDRTSPWRKLKSTNLTTASFADTPPVKVKPSGDGVIEVALPAGGEAPHAIVFKFFGTAAQNLNFNFRVYAFNYCLETDSWEPILLAELAVTLGNLAGVLGCGITDTDFEADTIAITYGNSNVDVSVVSPANDVRGAAAVMTLRGGTLLKCQFSMNSSAASANALYRVL